MSQFECNIRSVKNDTNVTEAVNGSEFCACFI